MAQTAFPPGFRVTDANDNPFPGAKLYFYDATTLNARTVYTDAALTVAHSHPVICDNTGLVPAIYLPTGLYRVIIKNSDGSVTVDDRDSQDGPIDTASLTTTEAKPIRAITTVITTGTDPTTSLGGVVLANPGGGNFTRTVPAASTGNGKEITYKNIGSTGSVILDGGLSTIDGDAQRILANQHDSITLVSDGADWHIDTSPPDFPLPQGRLSLVTGTPVITADQASKTTIYWAFDRGNVCPVKFGSIMVPVRVLSEPSLALTASNSPANTILDVFGALNSGTFVIGALAWTASGAGVGNRGTGGGTPELDRFQGIYVNKNSMTLKNGASTYSVAAQEGTYLGSYMVDTTAGQVSCHLSYGQSRKWAVWNAYNQEKIILLAGDAMTSWTVSTATITAFEAANKDPNNNVSFFAGLADHGPKATYIQNQDINASGQNPYVAIGWNSTGTASGFTGQSTATASKRTNLIATYDSPPVLGLHTVTPLQAAPSPGATFYGGEINCRMSVEWLG